MSARVIGITGLGAVTPVGLSAAATCAALRAGLPRMLEFEGWDDDGPAPDPDLIAGRVPLEWLTGNPLEEWPGHERWNLKLPRPHVLIEPGDERLTTLAAPAAQEAWAQAGSPAGRTGLYLGLDDADSGKALAESIARALGLTFEVVRGDRLGRAAGLAALHRAARHVRDGRVDNALVGAVDSRLRRSALAAMKEAGTLRGPGNPAGVIPGEAAAFVVLQGDGAGRVLATLDGTGVAEEATAGTDQGNRGEGLSLALRKAREAAPALESRPVVVGDLNGERYRTLEWGLVNVRVLGDVRSIPGGPASSDQWHAADCIGDTGAASGGVSLLWAVTAMRKRHARADRALVWGASDGPLRAAAILTRGN
jgi:3-oxoacyl-[acyl-carrier-protein] synthase-1